MRHSSETHRCHRPISRTRLGYSVPAKCPQNPTHTASMGWSGGLVFMVAVSHADPIKAAVAHALGMPLDLFQRIVIATASITAIAYARTNAAALTINSVDGDLAKVLA